MPTDAIGAIISGDALEGAPFGSRFVKAFLEVCQEEFLEREIFK